MAFWTVPIRIHQHRDGPFVVLSPSQCIFPSFDGQLIKAVQRFWENVKLDVLAKVHVAGDAIGSDIETEARE